MIPLYQAGFFVAREPGIVISMAEGQSMYEREIGKPLANQINEIFERRAIAGERKYILETYQQKFDQLLLTLPKEKRDTIAIKIQKFTVKIGGYLSEYSARLADYVRNVFVWPMVAASEDFPKDKFYQIELARAKAWGEFARDTTRTATAERMAYRDHFLPSAITGAEAGGIFGAVAGAMFAGVAKGTEIGFIAGGGLQGAAIGAAVGGALGGGTALLLGIKDRLIGPPVLYYDLFAGMGGSSININTGSNSLANPAALAPK